MVLVAVVDSHAIFAAGVAGILKQVGFRVAAPKEGATGPHHWEPDVFVVGDPSPSPAPALDLLVQQTVSVAPVLLLLQSPSRDVLRRYLKSGVSRILERSARPSSLVENVRTLAMGNSTLNDWKPTEVSSHDLVSLRDLSPRERQVLAQIAVGLTHGQIARRMGISQHTVDTHVKRIKSKLGLSSKAELTRAAIMGGIDHLAVRQPGHG